MNSLVRAEGSTNALTLSATVARDGQIFDYISPSYSGFTIDEARKDFLADLTRQGLKLVREQ